MSRSNFVLSYFFVFTLLFSWGDGIQCFQCASSDDAEGEDNCGAYQKFHKDRNIAIDCNSEESSVPGTFCMKVVQQSPKGFIWDGRWRQVIRRCASVAENGVTGVCNWGVYDNGVYWEECYCSEDGCNSAPPGLGTSVALVFTAVALVTTFWHSGIVT